MPPGPRTTTNARAALAAACALAAIFGLAVGAAPARADIPSDAYPSPQAQFAHAEFLLQTPAPPSGAGTICIIDTGVTPLPDMGNSIVERIAIDGGSPDDVYHQPNDPFSGHGSFVAGAIASQVDGVGSAGIWPAAKIISIRVFPPDGGPAVPADYRRAIDECERPARDVRVIALSLATAPSTSDDISRLQDRILTARGSYGIDVVAAAGNDPDELDYPARFPATLALGATDGSGQLCSWSARGDDLDISTLGCNTTITAFDGRSGSFAGTSFAVPTAAAVLLALRSYRPDLSPDQAEQLLVSNARDTSAGHVIDAEATFRAAGLAGLVDRYSENVSTGTAPTSSSLVQSSHSSAASATTPRLAKPTLTRATFRHRLLNISVTRPTGSTTTIFRIRGRSYHRRSGILRIRLRAWHMVTVVAESAWGVRSPELKVDRQSRR